MGQARENYEIWLEEVKRKQFSPLAENLEADVAVVGGGITGIFSAYLLVQAGLSVVLLEKGRLGEWTTDCTTAFLTQSVDTSYQDLIFSLGKEFARQVAESHGLAIDLVEKIVKEEKIDCDFKRISNHLIAKTKKEKDFLRRESEAMKSLDLSVQYKVGNDLKFPTLAHLEIANQATYHPMKFLASLAERATSLGAKIFEQTEVVSITKKGESWILKAGERQVKSREVILATYEPWGQPWRHYFKKAMYRSYVCELEAPLGAFCEGLYEDLLHPYHYFKVDNLEDYCRVIFGGEDHRNDLKISRAKNYQTLKEHSASILGYSDLRVRRKWSGPILESIDGRAYIGRDKRNGLLYAFAFSGNGLTYSVIAAALFKELLTQEKGEMSGYQKLYRVNRLPTLRSMIVKGKDYSLIFIGGFLKNFFISLK